MPHVTVAVPELYPGEAGRAKEITEDIDAITAAVAAGGDPSALAALERFLRCVDAAICVNDGLNKVALGRALVRQDLERFARLGYVPFPDGEVDD